MTISSLTPLFVYGYEGLLGVDLGLADAQCPNASACPLELLEQSHVVFLEVFVNDDVHSGILGGICHSDRTAAEDGNLGDVLSFEHRVEHAGADETGCASEDNMHFADKSGWCGVRNEQERRKNRMGEDIAVG